jgi:hypothetical protein
LKQVWRIRDLFAQNWGDAGKELIHET